MATSASSREHARLLLESAWTWTSPVRDYLWRWYHYTLREPLADVGQAQKTLRELSGYRLVFTTPHRIISVRPSLQRFRFGIWVTVEPVRQSGKWTQRWSKLVQDPVELWLLRSAVLGVPRPANQPSVMNRNDDVSDEEMHELLSPPSRR